MNSELHTLFWFIHEDLTKLLRKNKTDFKSIVREQVKCHSMYKHVGFDDEDVKEDEIPERELHNELNDILRGIIQTIDEILSTESMMLNTIFIMHVMRAFTVHKSNLQVCQDASNVIKVNLMPLEMSYTHVKCYIDLIVDVCRANLINICTKEMITKMSDTLYQKRKASTLDGRSCKRDAQNPVLIINSTTTNRTSTSPTLMKKASSSPTSTANVGIPFSSVPMLTKSVSGRRLIRLGSTSGLAVAQASLPEVSDAGDDIGWNNTKTISTTRPKTDAVVSNQSPHNVLRWRSAQEVIRLLVRQPSTLINHIHGKNKLDRHSSLD